MTNTFNSHLSPPTTTGVTM